MAVVGKGSRTANATRTAQGTEDVNFTLPNNTDHIILGCGVGDDNGDRMKVGDTFRLQFKTGGDAFANVVSGSGAVRLGATDLVESNALTSGERLSTGLFDSYVDGEEKETINPDGMPRQVRDETTEMQWSLDFSNAVASTTYDFRVGWEASGTEFFVTYISIITTTGGPVTGVGTATGTSTTTGVGISTAAADGSSIGTSTAPGVGVSTATGDGTATGTSTALGTGITIFKGVGSSVGVGTATGIGTSIAAGDGDAAGSATTTGDGVSTVAADGASSGAATTTGDGVSTATGDGSSSGTSTTTGDGVSTAAADGASAGVATSTAVGQEAGTTVTGVGDAAGTATAIAVGVSKVAQPGSSAGVATSSGDGVSTFAATGTATGSATATGPPTVFGVSAGTATASGDGKSTAAATGTAVGTATVLGFYSGSSFYDVLTFNTESGPLDNVLSLLETHLETIDDTKTLRFFDITKLSTNRYRGIIIYDT